MKDDRPDLSLYNILESNSQLINLRILISSFGRLKGSYALWPESSDKEWKSGFRKGEIRDKIRLSHYLFLFRFVVSILGKKPVSKPISGRNAQMENT